MVLKIISHGAEAKILASDDYIIKYRMSKPYRIADIDKNLIRKRTKREQRIIKKLQEENVPVPKLFKYKDFFETSQNIANIEECEISKELSINNAIIMQKLKGVTMTEYIRDKTKEEKEVAFTKLGALISKIHDCNIIHGDITLNNFIVGDDIYAIDFGLSFVSNKDEDKAVDLYVFERALLCTYDCGTESFYKGYQNEGVIKRLEKVRMRGRKREENAFG